MNRRTIFDAAYAAVLALVVCGFAQQSTATRLAPGQSLGIVSVPNLRDIGGYVTSDGKLVRRGLAYRSDQLNPISAEDLVRISELGLKNDFDLRTDEEA